MLMLEAPMRARVGMLVSAAWLVLAVPTSAVAQEDDAAKVRALEMKWTDSYKQRKIDILASLLSDDFVITVEDGATYSKSGYITHTADTSVQVKLAELSDLKVHLHGNAAVVTGAYREGNLKWSAVRVSRPAHGCLDE